MTELDQKLGASGAMHIRRMTRQEMKTPLSETDRERRRTQAERPDPDQSIVGVDGENHVVSYDVALREEGKPRSSTFSLERRETGCEPYTCGGPIDLRADCTPAEFRGAAASFHNEFFGEHPDNVIFANLMKCLSAKIFDERNTKKGEAYKFQVFYRNGKEESARSVFDRINRELYSPAYTRYIDPGATTPDEINPKEFPPERVKTVVKVMQGVSLTRGAALHGDIIGAFFEEIVRVGFKQDKGMYFTHANLVEFMLEAVDLKGLVVETWRASTHPNNRLPYIIDPACGSGSFLLKAARKVTEAIAENYEDLAADFESGRFRPARMSPSMPNYRAEHFLYGLDPKFIMAITAKVNMVLHGDGSAHIFKQDAFAPLSTFHNHRFRPADDPARTIPKSRHPYDVCETFDLVVSNPPFGIALSSDTQAKLSETFLLGDTCASEELFLERCFQLLKPAGRLAIVAPESLLNTSGSIDARLFLHRCFRIKAVVSLPRNVFIDTPILTSLLFAQKKTAAEIDDWDDAWKAEEDQALLKVKQAERFLTQAGKLRNLTAGEIRASMKEFLSPIVSEDTRVVKSGRKSAIMGFTPPRSVTDAREAVGHYREFLRPAGFNALIKRYVFRQVSDKLNYEFPVFIVDEVGCKLSRRREKARPNQLCRFISKAAGDEPPNLHLAAEPYVVEVRLKNPDRVLDYIKKQEIWT